MLLARLTRAHHSMVSRSRRHPCSKLVSSAFATSQPEWSPVHVTSSCELLLAFRCQACTGTAHSKAAALLQ